MGHSNHQSLKPAFLMLVVQVVYAGATVLYKLVANDGMSLSVLMAYRYLFASAFMVPLAYFVERKSKPKITAKVLFQAFFCGLFGASLQQNLYVEAVILANATYATAMYSLIPGVTFILAICFRLEMLKIGTSTGKAKVLGTVMGIGGAMMLTFWKSIEIHFWSTRVNLMKHQQPKNVPTTHHILGSSLALGTCISYSIWLIIQARMSEKFPWYCTSAALMSMMASIQSTIFALCMERNHWSQWKLGWNIRLLTAVYTGVVSSGLVWVIISWCVRVKGPLYTSAFNPLFLVLVAIAGYLLLDEKLHLGSVMGLLLIVCWLYIVLWGKGKELIEGSLEVEPLEIITKKHPLGKGLDDKSDMKSGDITSLSSFLTENDHVQKQGKGQNAVKDVPIKGTEENNIKEIPFVMKDSKA